MYILTSFGKILWTDFPTCSFNFVKVSSGDLSNCIVDVVSTLSWWSNHVYNNNDMFPVWHELCNLRDHICKHKWAWWLRGWWGPISGDGAPQAEVRVHILDIPVSVGWRTWMTKNFWMRDVKKKRLPMWLRLIVLLFDINIALASNITIVWSDITIWRPGTRHQHDCPVFSSKYYLRYWEVHYDWFQYALHNKEHNMLLNGW